MEIFVRPRKKKPMRFNAHNKQKRLLQGKGQSKVKIEDAIFKSTEKVLSENVKILVMDW